MTIEHRLLVDLREVRALRLECPQCHAAVSFALTEFIRVPEACPGCRATWVDPMKPETQTVAAVVHAIKALLRLPADRTGCVLRLEVDAPATATSTS